MSEAEPDKSPVRDVRKIIEDAGGFSAVAAAVSAAATMEKDRITIDAVYKWSKIGIPERNWPVVMPLANASEAELHAANVAARQQKVA